MESLNEKIRRIANAKGFEGVYFLKAEHKEYDCVLLLMYPYPVFCEDTYVPAYYLASNRSFHLMKELTRELNEQGVCCENVHVNVKQTAADARVGALGKNSLLHTKKWGSRVVLHTLLVKGACEEEYDEVPENLCDDCSACASACPTGAISRTGYSRNNCIRNYMENPPYPKWVEKNIKTYLGCERCMQVCPYNAHVAKTEVPLEAIYALDPARVLTGNVREAKQLVGKNVKSSRLMADALTLLKNRE